MHKELAGKSDLKAQIPKFKGEQETDVSLDWAAKADQKFCFKHTAPEQKVDGIIPSLTSYVQIWWSQISREAIDLPPILDWEELKDVKRYVFVPDDYNLELY